MREKRRAPWIWTVFALLVLALAGSGVGRVRANKAPGVTATEIKFGQRIASSARLPRT